MQHISQSPAPAPTSVWPPVVRGQAISPERWKAALAKYEHATAAEVSAEFGIAVHTIYQHVSRLGIGKTRNNAPRPRIVTRQHMPQSEWDKARIDYEKGNFTAREVARRYGVKYDAVKGRAFREKWRKIDPNRVPTQPLYTPPPPEEEPPAPVDALAAWRATAHPAQLPPESKWSTWLFQGGRGAGKTRAGAEWIAAFAADAPDARIALVGATLRDVREVMFDGPSGLANLPHRAPPRFEAGRQRLVFASGAVAYAFSSQEPERLRGPQFDAAWADEFCAWKKPDYTLKMLRMGLRRGADPRLVVTTTPKPMKELRALRAEASCTVSQAATAANAAHLAPAFIDGLTALYGGTRFAARELEGMLVDDEDLALWKAKDIANLRGAPPPAFDEVVVGVDPPAGSNGAACGIVVAGRRGDRAYVLADRSVQGLSPLGWSSRVADAAAEFRARTVVAEANQGGDMVRTTLAGAGVACAIRLVHATRNKRTRAEPVAALYERELVTHCDAFPQLEEQLMAIGDADSEMKLDRADALVWAITALLVEGRREGPRISIL